MQVISIIQYNNGSIEAQYTNTPHCNIWVKKMKTTKITDEEFKKIRDTKDTEEAVRLIKEIFNTTI